MFQSNIRSSKLMAAPLVSLCALVAVLLMAQNSHAYLSITEDLGDEWATYRGTYYAMEDITKPIIINGESHITINLQSHNVRTGGDWSILVYNSHDITITGSSTHGPVENSQGFGIYAVDSDELEIVNLNVTGQISGIATIGCDDLKITNVTTRGIQNVGIWVEDSMGATLTNAQGNYSGWHGIVAYQGESIVLENCDAQGNALNGITMLNTTYFEMHDCEARNNYFGFVWSNSQGMYDYGCSAYNNTINEHNVSSSVTRE